MSAAPWCGYTTVSPTLKDICAVAPFVASQDTSALQDHLRGPGQTGTTLPFVEVEAGGGFARYPLDARFHDECFDADGRVRPAYRRLVAQLSGLSTEELAAKAEAIELSLRAQGITFTVYNAGNDVERTFPLDLVPRIVAAVEWEQLDRKSTRLNSSHGY